MPQSLSFLFMNYPLTQMEEHRTANPGLQPWPHHQPGSPNKKSKIMLDMFNIMSQFRWYWNLAVILRRRLCLSSRVNSKGRRETTLFLFEKIMHQSIPPAPSPLPRATAGHLPALSVPGVAHLQIFHCPGTGHLPTPGAFPSFLQERGFLSGYNYTEGFTGKKKADWLICQGQE